MSQFKKNPEFVDKVCNTCKNTYQISFYKRKTSVYCSKKCSNVNEDVLTKMRTSQKKTYDEKYNGLHPMQTDKTKENLKSSLLNKYGVTSYSKLTEYKEKVKSTSIEKYGVENYSQTTEFKSRFKKSCLAKYGVDNPMKSPDIKEKVKNTCVEKYGVECYSRSMSSISQHHDLTYSKIIKFPNMLPLFTRDEFHGVTKNIHYKFQCLRCDTIVSIDLQDGNVPICVNCDKLNTSFAQKEIYDYIKTYVNNEILLNDRNLIYPKEVDIYIPDLNLAIEYNSFYYHTEISGNKNKQYHLRKLQSTLFKGVTLIQIFEHEWSNKKPIVQSVLRNKLNSFDKKIYARNCIIKELTAFECNVFLNNNHIQGSDHSSIRIGLYYNDELVSVMTFVKSRYDKKIQYEMSRFCNKLNYKITGGASKLFKYFVTKYSPISVCSYNDRRYFDGGVYEKLNFTIINNTSPCYFYIKNKKLYNRMNFQKHKLKKLLTSYDPLLSEWENMKLNGYDRIWDCGNGKWIFRNTNVTH